MLALVVGTGRSGTTLVQETLSRHPSVGFVSGVDDKLSRVANLRGRHNGRLFRGGAQRPSSMRALQHAESLFESGRVRVAPSEGYQLLDRFVMAGFSRPCRDLVAEDVTPYLRERTERFFAERIEAQGCDVLLHHLTGWPRTGFLREAFPDLKVVHVVRDGRAVVNSWLQMGWWDGWLGPDKWIYGPLPEDLRKEWEAAGQSFVVLAALGWRMLLDAYERAREVSPEGTWLDVRHEDVLADPRAAFGSMLDFLGLDWSPEFEDGFARHEVEVHRRSSWETELAPHQVREATDTCAPTLARWGYEV